MIGKWDFLFDDKGKHGGVTIRVNPEYMSTINQRLKPYQNFPNTLRPALVAVADYVMMEMIPRTFKQEGPGWRQLSRRTRAERAAAGYSPMHPILYRSGDLFKELTERGHPHHVEIIKTGKYSRIEVGGSSEKFYRNQGGNWLLHIPSRPMIPGTGNLKLPDRDRAKIRKILIDAVKKETNKNVRT